MTTYLATLNGRPCTAKKVDGRWTVGGDYDLSGSIMLVMKRNGRDAWFSLRGCTVKFQDWATPDEIAALT